MMKRMHPILVVFFTLFSIYSALASPPSDPTINPTDPICSNQAPFNLTADDEGGVWSGMGITDLALGTFDPSGLAPGFYTITYTLGDAFAEIEIEILAMDNADFDYPYDSYCWGGNNLAIPDVYGLSGGTFSASGGLIIDSFSGAISIDDNPQGNFEIYYTTNGSCPNSSVFSLSIGNETATILTTDSLCVTDTPITLEAEEIGGYWNGPGITDSSNGTFDPDVANIGSNEITYTIDGSCISVDTTIINVGNIPFVSAAGNTTIAAGQSAPLFATSSDPESNFSWLPITGLSCADCPDPMASPYVTTVYDVTVTTPFGCEAAGQVLIEVEDILNVYLPTMFSPNGDGQNDVFRLRGSPLFDYTMKVFNRWGQVVFESDDFRFGWDGKHNGSPVEAGVFAYQIKGTTAGGKDVEESGQITLIR